MKNSLKNIHKGSGGVTLFVSLTFFLLCSFWGTVFGGAVIDRVIAVVGKEVITQSDLDRLMSATKGTTAMNSPGDQWSLLRRLIEERLILQEVRRKNISVTDSELEFALKDIEARNRFPNRETFKQAVAKENQSWAQYVSELKSQLLILKLLNREIDINIVLNKKEVQSYYNAHLENFKLPDRIHLKQLLLKLSPEASEEKARQVHRKAERIYSEIKKGVPFEQLASKYSEGPARNRGGNLGFFNKGDLSAEIDSVVFKLKKGEISTPIGTRLGIHLFKVEEREEGRRRPFEAVRKEIEEKLISETRGALQAKWIDGLFEQTYVDIK